MKNTIMDIMLALMLLSGCSISPSPAISPKIQTLKVGDNEGCFAFHGSKPRFAIVTDGSINGRCTCIAHLDVTYEGKINASGLSKEVAFHAKGNNIDIGNQHYNLKEGSLFLVTVERDPFEIRQFKISEHEKISGLIAADERMADFFN